MKLLILQKIKREVPTAKWARLLPFQSRYFDKLEKQNTLEVTYHLIGQQGSMLVVNAESEEALSRIVGEDPMFDLEREICPLTTRDTMRSRVSICCRNRRLS